MTKLELLPGGRQPRDVVQVESLSVNYGARVVLDGVSLRAARGRLLALLGPSGAGKSTLLHCLNRMTDLVPGCRVEGTIRLDGRDVHRAVPVTMLRRQVGLIFQKPNPFPLSIWRNLELPLREHVTSNRAELADRIEDVLEAVGLWKEVQGRLDDRAETLSGGQQQRLCVARALTLSPKVLLLDEPTSALDPVATRVMEDLITRLKSELALVMVTHDPSQARRLADDLAVLVEGPRGGGIIAEQGPTGQLLERPAHAMTVAYLGNWRSR
ncbi:MAG: ATP-binding cassette domain-containing protein [Deltaproteobacteria bacterium]|nr:ATP-binding cassette domain-containing protein [Deltaproteobacteria bacterium]